MKKTFQLAVICALTVFSLASTVRAQEAHTIAWEDYTLELPTF